MNLSRVEQAFLSEIEYKEISTVTPYITVDNFPKLGLLTALRFLEWVLENPKGVISFVYYLFNFWNLVQDQCFDDLREGLSRACTSLAASTHKNFRPPFVYIK